MSNSYLNLTAVGNVGEAPDLKYTQSGVPVCSFSLAVNRTIGSGDNRRESTVWLKVTCWRQLAETVNQHVSKGDAVLIECDDLKAHAYLGGGIPKGSLDVTAQKVIFLGKRTQTVEESAGWPDEQQEDIPF